MRGRVLVVAGSDSGGGAGIQADIKTITALDAYAMTAITALTAQDTQGVHAVYPVPPAFVAQQMESVLADIGADAVKIGMLHNEAVMDVVCDVLAPTARHIPIVLDPVMIAKGGRHLLDEDAVAALKRRLFILAAVVTPNVPEAEVLSGMTIYDVPSMRHAAEAMLTLGVPAVLLKGGHLPGAEVVDLLATEAGVEEFRSPRIASRHTHGTGCTLASAVATGLAQGMSLRDSVARARAYVRLAIQSAPGFGSGHGPINHAVTIDQARLAALGA
jgi:hydroxymethylpyrimidine/phosphomethylpyrimidine kinase